MGQFENLKIICLLIFPLVIISCKPQINIQQEKEVMKQADINFSNYSVENGINKAFTKFMHSEVVLLADSSMPFVGYDKVSALFKGDDSGIQLSWKPLSAIITIQTPCL